jgi:NADH:ubiquinone oxidoreductase subunit K|uniref:NADH dehydrogenase subunit 4L n=2 Tax=Chrysochromulina TaxID=35140 RepID=A0A075DWX0_9EUKA|nr:NADH dehydrogenase subunit 4L [Chrysochromulina parva]AHY04432.1 NADH dehydrogenase subunit 4L [Chrysochromulina tobinii]AUS84447.1 NADH dehydrogenase subunit 4L [Chrysochromulina parva]
MNFITLVFIPITILLVSLIGIFVNRKNVLLIIICVELALLAINFSFLVSSFYLDDSLGQIFAFFVLSVAAAESSIGLAILVAYYRVHGSITIESVRLLKG